MLGQIHHECENENRRIQKNPAITIKSKNEKNNSVEARAKGARAKEGGTTSTDNTRVERINYTAFHMSMLNGRTLTTKPCIEKSQRLGSRAKAKTKQQRSATTHRVQIIANVRMR